MNSNNHIPVAQHGFVTSTQVCNILPPPPPWTPAPLSCERLSSANIQAAFNRPFTHSLPTSFTLPDFFHQPNQNMPDVVAQTSLYMEYFSPASLHPSARQLDIFSNPFSLYLSYINHRMHGESIPPNTLPWQRKNFNHRPTPYARPDYAKPEQYQSRSGNRSYFAGNVRTPSLELTQLKEYQDDNKEVVKTLNSLHKEPSISKVLFIRPHNNKGLAYYETTPFCVKLDFSIDKESKNPPRDIDQRDLKIRETFESDRSKMSEYLNKHQPGAFRQIKLQNERGENIPIHIKGTSLHRTPDSIPHQVKVIEKKDEA